MPILILLAVLAAAFPFCPAQAGIYRCEGDDGHISYQQIRCHSDAEPMRLQRRKSGWSALRPGERALLEQYHRSTAAAERKSPGEVDSTGMRSESCGKKRRQLEQVRTQLRRGYKLGESDRLHRNRDSFVDYLRQFCS